jgi:hypothetical protein
MYILKCVALYSFHSISSNLKCNLKELTLDVEMTLGWTDWKLFAHRHNKTTAEVAEYIKSGTVIPMKLITINNPLYLKSIWKPNLYIC